MKDKQQTIQFYVNNITFIHKDKKVNDWFEEWLQQEYRQYGKVNATW